METNTQSQEQDNKRNQASITLSRRNPNLILHDKAVLPPEAGQEIEDGKQPPRRTQLNSVESDLTEEEEEEDCYEDCYQDLATSSISNSFETWKWRLYRSRNSIPRMTPQSTSSSTSTSVPPRKENASEEENLDSGVGFEEYFEHNRKRDQVNSDEHHNQSQSTSTKSSAASEQLTTNTTTSTTSSMSSADSAYTSAESESSEVRINTPKNEPQVHCKVHQPTPQQQQQQQPPPRRWQTEDAQIRAEEEERHRQLLGLLRRMKASMAAMNEQIRSKPALEPLPLPKQEETMLFTVEPPPPPQEPQKTPSPPNNSKPPPPPTTTTQSHLNLSIHPNHSQPSAHLDPSTSTSTSSRLPPSPLTVSRRKCTAVRPSKDSSNDQASDSGQGSSSSSDSSSGSSTSSNQDDDEDLTSSSSADAEEEEGKLSFDLADYEGDLVALRSLEVLLSSTAAPKTAEERELEQELGALKQSMAPETMAELRRWLEGKEDEEETTSPTSPTFKARSDEMADDDVYSSDLLKSSGLSLFDSCYQGLLASVSDQASSHTHSEDNMSTQAQQVENMVIQSGKCATVELQPKEDERRVVLTTTIERVDDSWDGDEDEDEDDEDEEEERAALTTTIERVMDNDCDGSETETAYSDDDHLAFFSEDDEEAEELPAVQVSRQLSPPAITDADVQSSPAVGKSDLPAIPTSEQPKPASPAPTSPPPQQMDMLIEGDGPLRQQSATSFSSPAHSDHSSASGDSDDHHHHLSPSSASYSPHFGDFEPSSFLSPVSPVSSEVENDDSDDQIASQSSALPPPPSAKADKRSKSVTTRPSLSASSSKQSSHTTHPSTSASSIAPPSPPLQNTDIMEKSSSSQAAEFKSTLALEKNADASCSADHQEMANPASFALLNTPASSSAGDEGGDFPLGCCLPSPAQFQALEAAAALIEEQQRNPLESDVFISGTKATKRKSRKGVTKVQRPPKRTAAKARLERQERKVRGDEQYFHSSLWRRHRLTGDALETPFLFNLLLCVNCTVVLDTEELFFSHIYSRGHIVRRLSLSEAQTEEELLKGIAQSNVRQASLELGQGGSRSSSGRRLSHPRNHHQQQQQRQRSSSASRTSDTQANWSANCLVKELRGRLTREGKLKEHPRSDGRRSKSLPRSALRWFDPPRRCECCLGEKPEDEECEDSEKAVVQTSSSSTQRMTTSTEEAGEGGSASSSAVASCQLPKLGPSSARSIFPGRPKKWSPKFELGRQQHKLTGSSSSPSPSTSASNSSSKPNSTS